MKHGTFNGWTILFHPAFARQWQQLFAEVKKISQTRSTDEFQHHPKVKLLKALKIGIEQTITQDPFASRFRLRGDLKQYGRLKKMGLPERCRLFFLADRQTQEIIILWLGELRKAGDKHDAYNVFKKKVRRGEFPRSFNDLISGDDSR